MPDDCQIDADDSPHGFVAHKVPISENAYRDITGQIFDWSFVNDSIMATVKDFIKNSRLDPRSHRNERLQILEAAAREYPRNINSLLKLIQATSCTQSVLYEALLDQVQVNKEKAVDYLFKNGVTHKKDVDGLTRLIFDNLCNRIPDTIVAQYDREIAVAKDNKKTRKWKSLTAVLLRAKGYDYKSIASQLGNKWESKDDDNNIRKYVNYGKQYATEYDPSLTDLSKWLDQAGGSSGPRKKHPHLK